MDDETLSELLPALRRFALSLTRESTSADDLVQSTLERAIERKASRSEEGNPRAWLFSILYRKFLDGERRRKRLNRFLGALQIRFESAESSSPEAIFTARAELAEFAKLPPDQRTVLLLVGVEGMSYQDAAAILDVPIGTVMSRLSRARSALAKITQDESAMPPLRLVRRTP
jgi:RNA polymerase sigma-70 factor (ECF subfamily)